jgi:bacterial/archaeal transporter family-2 protein
MRFCPTLLGAATSVNSVLSYLFSWWTRSSGSTCGEAKRTMNANYEWRTMSGVTRVAQHDWRSITGATRERARDGPDKQRRALVRPAPRKIASGAPLRVTIRILRYMTWLFLFLAIAAGAFNPAQSGANAELNKQFGHILPAALLVYGSALVGLLLFQLVLRQPIPDHGSLVAIPWWAWLGGVISVVPTIAGLALAQKMGSGAFTGAAVTAAVVTSILFDHFALMGFRQHAASLPRIVGGALMIAGLWLVAKF